MQVRLAIASLALALVLGLLTVWAYSRPASSGLNKPSSDAARASTLAQLDPSLITRIVASPSTDANCVMCDTSIRFDDALDTWLYEEQAQPNTMGKRWPVDAARARGFGRLLADLARAESIDSMDLAWSGPRLQVDASSPGAVGVRSWNFVFSAGSLAGFTIVGELFPAPQARKPQASPHTTIARKALGDWNALLQRESLRAWRTSSPFSLDASGTGVLGIDVRSAGRLLSLSLREGRWGLVSPVAAPADEARVRELLAAIAGASAERFIDDGPMASPSAHADQPIAEVVLTSRLANAKPTDPLTQRLRVHAPADASSQTFFVLAHAQLGDSPAWGPQTLVMARSSIESLAKDPTWYIPPRSVQRPAADVGSIAIASGDRPLTTLTRRDTRWDGERAGSRFDLGALKDLATLLCDLPASSVEIAPPADASEVILATLDIRSLAGSSLERCAIVKVDATPGESHALWVRVGPVRRRYDQAKPILDALSALATAPNP